MFDFFSLRVICVRMQGRIQKVLLYGSRSFIIRMFGLTTELPTKGKLTFTVAKLSLFINSVMINQSFVSTPHRRSTTVYLETNPLYNSLLLAMGNCVESGLRTTCFQSSVA